MTEKALRTNDVVALTGLSRSTLWRLERAGSFPARRQLTAGSVCWLASEIDSWLRSRPTVSDTDAAA